MTTYNGDPNFEAKNQTAADLAYRGAPLNDRMLAFGFDLCLWAPIALLLGKPLWRDFQYHNTLSPGSTEAMMFFGFGLFIALMFILSVQTFCVWKFGATPGKKLFLLTVVHQYGGRLTLGQSFTRALTQIFEFLCLGIPFLEIVSHAERRPWHDRLAESRVISLKPKQFQAPHELESRFFRNLYWGFGLSMLLLAWSALWQVHQQVKIGAMKRPELEKSGYLCEAKTKLAGHSGMTAAQARLDFALAQFEAGVLDTDCIEAEADFAIWTQAEELLPWAHLIRGVLADRQNLSADSMKELQFAKACAEPTRGLAQFGEAKTSDEQRVHCQLARYFQGDQNAELESGSWTAQVALLKQAIGAGDFAKVETLTAKSTWPSELASYVQDLGLKALALKGASTEFQAGLKLLMPLWDETQRYQTLAWACFAEITKACGKNASPQVCADLRKELEIASDSAWTDEVTMTFALETKCYNRMDAVVQNHIKKRFNADEKLAWIFDLKDADLKQLAEVPQSHWSRPYLLWWAGRKQQNSEALAMEFQKTSRSEPNWWVAYQSHSIEDEAPIKQVRGLSSVESADGAAPASPLQNQKAE